MFLPQPFPGDPASLLIPDPVPPAFALIADPAPPVACDGPEFTSVTGPATGAIDPVAIGARAGDAVPGGARAKDAVPGGARAGEAMTANGERAAAGGDGGDGGGGRPNGERIGRSRTAVERRPFGPTISEPAVALRRGRPAALREAR
ncbi:hypothetical protein [Actinoplanes subglobosus]|uniref:Uncharacterized protein n=1 Tax=Actinoplanes subglobosus TaxID=1547892 RepID=A0ABV8JCG9_9ACTN